MSSTLNFEQARFNMVEQQVRPWDVLDPAVLGVLGKLRREDFVPPRFRKLAFADLAVPLPHGQQMLKPVVEGRLLQELEAGPDDEVLHVGTGSGFFAACLGRLARLVTSVERIPELAEKARQRLHSAGIHNVSVVTADALAGYEPKLRFDRIVLTGAVHTVPEKLLSWLVPGGSLLAVVGEGPAMRATRLQPVPAGPVLTETLFETELPYLHGGEPPRPFAF